MNFHGKDIKIFAANSVPQVAEQIARHLGLPLGDAEVKTFSDGEIAVSINESVRGSDVFVVQSTCEPGQRSPDGAAHYDRCIQARFRWPDHRCDPLLSAMPVRTARPRAAIRSLPSWWQT